MGLLAGNWQTVTGQFHPFPSDSPTDDLALPLEQTTNPAIWQSSFVPQQVPSKSVTKPQHHQFANEFVWGPLSLATFVIGELIPQPIALPASIIAIPNIVSIPIAASTASVNLEPPVRQVPRPPLRRLNEDGFMIVPPSPNRDYGWSTPVQPLRKSGTTPPRFDDIALPSLAGSLADYGQAPTQAILRAARTVIRHDTGFSHPFVALAPLGLDLMALQRASYRRQQVPLDHAFVSSSVAASPDYGWQPLVLDRRPVAKSRPAEMPEMPPVFAAAPVILIDEPLLRIVMPPVSTIALPSGFIFIPAAAPAGTVDYGWTSPPVLPRVVKHVRRDVSPFEYRPILVTLPTYNWNMTVCVPGASTMNSMVYSSDFSQPWSNGMWVDYGVTGPPQITGKHKDFTALFGPLDFQKFAATTPAFVEWTPQVTAKISRRPANPPALADIYFAIAAQPSFTAWDVLTAQRIIRQTILRPNLGEHLPFSNNVPPYLQWEPQPIYRKIPRIPNPIIPPDVYFVPQFSVFQEWSSLVPLVPHKLPKIWRPAHTAEPTQQGGPFSFGFPNWILAPERPAPLLTKRMISTQDSPLIISTPGIFPEMEAPRFRRAARGMNPLPGSDWVQVGTLFVPLDAMPTPQQIRRAPSRILDTNALTLIVPFSVDWSQNMPAPRAIRRSIQIPEMANLDAEIQSEFNLAWDQPFAFRAIQRAKAAIVRMPTWEYQPFHGVINLLPRLKHTATSILYYPNTTRILFIPNTTRLVDPDE